MTNPRSVTSSVILAATVVIVAVVIAVTAIAVLVEDGPRALSLIAPIVGLVPVLIGFLTLVAKVDNITTKVDQAADTVEQLANGGGDAKVRAVVVEALRDDLVDPQARERVEADRRAALVRDATQRLLENKDG